MPIQPGTDIGRYHILEKLGEGGMAMVYKAYDTRLECEVAIKFIRVDRLIPENRERTLKRFEIEAKKMAQLQHPNIVKVTDFGEHEGVPYLVMEYLPGGTLKQRLGKPIPYPEAIKLLIPIADALEYAHKKGLIHRDIKPSNILITESGQTMLSDFGVAKILESEETLDLTITGMGVGTPEYIAPEQAEGKTVDARADIYALGVVLYELVTGRKPFTADTPMAILVKQIHDPLPRPTQFVPELPEEVEHVLFKALAKDPNDRYKNTQQLKESLNKAVMAGKYYIEPFKEIPKPTATDKEVESHKQPWWQRWYLWAGAAAVMLLIVMINRPTEVTPPTITTDESKETISWKEGKVLKVVNLINSVQGDKFYYGSAVRGVEKAGEDFNIEYKHIEAGKDSSKWQPALENAAANEEYNVVILGTCDMVEYLEIVAPQYPEKKFIFYDCSVNYETCKNACANVYSMLFKSNEGSYLAGLYAGLMTETGIVGAVGGMDIDTINDFTVGYQQGVSDAAIDRGMNIQIIVQYADSFDDPTKGKELALAIYQQGADYVFQIAGRTGAGVFQAAQEVGKYAIGVDSDQALIIEETNPEQAAFIPTSMLKNLDNILYRAIKMHLEGSLPYGTSETFGLAEGGVGLAYNKYYEEMTPQEVKDAIAQAEQDILDGRIIVDTIFKNY